jgi:hypothetical protein
MQPHIFVTRRARNLPLSALNRPRRRSLRITGPALAVAFLAAFWLAALAIAWLIIR